jgi:heterodisulfide reductase subunit A
VACVDADRCCGCQGCIEVCPYQAMGFNAVEKKAEVNAALCKGCGACAATCPAEAVVLMGFDNRQIYAQIKEALAA